MSSLRMSFGDKIIHSPYTGGVYLTSESIAESNFANPMELIGTKKLMTLKETSVSPFTGTVKEGAEKFYTHTTFDKIFTATTKSHLQSKLAQKELIATIQEEGMTPKGYMAAMQLDEMKKQMSAGSNTPVPGIGQDAIDPLRVIEIITKIRGLRPNIFVTEQGFQTINVNKLDARTPEQDTRNGQVQMKPMEKVNFDKLEYAEGKFNLKKNTFPTLIASESMMRSDFSLQQLNMTDSMIGHARMRNGQALQALSTLSGAVGGTPTFSINDPEATGASAIPHGQFNVKKEVLALIQSHLEANESIIDEIFINPIDYARWESNYDVGGTLNAHGDVSVSGVIPMRGIPSVTAYLDRAVPRGLMYFVDSQSAMKGVGPFETEFWKEYTRDAHAFLTRDYVEFILPNPGRYGIKVQIAGTGADVFTPGTEIVTRKDLETYVQGPQNLLNKAVVS